LQHTENLIVGLGIAGINLCHQLEKQGRSYIVIDNCPSNSASLVAGGLYNPIGLKRKIKSWKVDDLFSVLSPTYKELEETLSTKLLHNLPILKPISSLEELPEWETAINEGRISPYVETLVKQPPVGPFQPNVVGSAYINHSGFLNMRSTVLRYREYLLEKQLLEQQTFDYFAIEELKNTIRYKEIETDRIIFCEGRYISQNPFFSWIPMKPTKGQMLTVKVSPTLSPEQIYNQQFYMFPTVEKDVFRLGATYDWHDLNEEPTQAAKEDLISKVRRALNVEMEVLEHDAAIRPNVRDRRPVLGTHPDNNKFLLFNGMGSKGVMLAPYFAKQFVDHIYDDSELDTEVNLNRFVKRFYENT